MEKFIPYEKLSKKWSEWQRSARCKSASSDAASAGHRNRNKRKIDKARRQTWNSLNPVTRKPENSKAYNRNKARNWKREYHETSSGISLYEREWRYLQPPTMAKTELLFFEKKFGRVADRYLQRDM